MICMPVCQKSDDYNENVESKLKRIPGSETWSVIDECNVLM